jgi:phospholipase C
LGFRSHSTADFFGNGSRVPSVVASPFSSGGKAVHTYFDRVLVRKFSERNWGLNALNKRSRDNLPNPISRSQCLRTPQPASGWEPIRYV